MKFFLNREIFRASRRTSGPKRVTIDLKTFQRSLNYITSKKGITLKAGTMVINPIINPSQNIREIALKTSRDNDYGLYIIAGLADALRKHRGPRFPQSVDILTLGALMGGEKICFYTRHELFLATQTALAQYLKSVNLGGGA